MTGLSVSSRRGARHVRRSPSRRRFDHGVLRWHGRLDSGAYDTVLIWAIASVAFVVFAALAEAKFRGYESGADLAQVSQTLWAFGRGRAPPGSIDGFSLLAQHGSLIWYPLGWLSRWLPASEVAITAQSAALAVAVVPLFRLARKVLAFRIGAALCLVFVFLLHPVIWAAALTDVHSGVVAVPALVAACRYGLGGERYRLGLAVLVVLCCRADLALLLAPLGVLLSLLRRPRAGLAVTTGALVWFGASLVLDWLGAGDGWAPVPGAYGAFGTGPAAVSRQLLAHPMETLGQLLAEKNFRLVVALLLPLGLTPLVAWRWLAAVFPYGAYLMLGDVPSTLTNGALGAPIVALAVVAATYALLHWARPSTDRAVVPAPILGGLVVVAAVLFVLDAPASPYRQPWQWASFDQADRDRTAALSMVGAGESVQAPAALLARLANRSGLYLAKPGEPPDERAEVVVAQGTTPLILDGDAGWRTRLRAGDIVVWERVPWERVTATR